MISEISNLGLSNSDGTITPSEFKQGAHNFALKWEKICYDHDLPSWFWISTGNPSFISSYDVDGYLSMEQMRIFNSAEATEEVHYYDFHIVYSDSYRIPVLYFRGYNSDGQPLLLSDIERDLPANSAKLLTESKWTFITQLEHPHLKRPWYTLHPCGTNELMKILTSTSQSKTKDEPESYLISWLSIVSHVVGLKIPLQLATPQSDVSIFSVCPSED